MKLLKLVPDDTNIKFLRWRVPFYIVSVVLMILSWVAVFTMGLNYGVDFAGGQEVRLTFQQQKEAPIPQLRDLVGDLGYGEPVVQEFGQPNQVSIRVPLPAEVEATPGAATEIGNPGCGRAETALKRTHERSVSSRSSAYGSAA